uniref:Uncharacterized protein n=1 Tax=Arundo donax TaxID=35708 RepID=A0A0A9E610_ARUDO
MNMKMNFLSVRMRKKEMVLLPKAIPQKRLLPSKFLNYHLKN